ncbi:hypothetical protein PENSPDRAFT_660192 [Peniophora sp. CONT]|nr:hypothetical protein PENSPDRAFT_660192 [Peniophora sp. CONT]
MPVSAMPASRPPPVSRNPFADPAGPPLPPKASGGAKYSTPREGRDGTGRSADSPSRARPARSQTSAGSPAPRPPPVTSRSMSAQDSAHRSGDKPKNHKSKKPSMHADVIDRLDFSGVGPMFHHDGPFDAAAPSRNKSRQKAPMFAWTGEDALDRPSHDGPYAAASPKNADYMNHAYADPPKKQVDAIAEAWGIHEPEPFEDFSAGGGGERATYSTINREPKRSHEERPRNARRPTAIPPPAPIFGDEPLPQEEMGPSSYAAPSSPNGGAGLGRNKSLMQRIRKMRDAPNVPVGAPGGPTAAFDEPERGASLGGRPRERSKPAQYGRSQSQTRGPGPTSPDSFVYVDDPKMKELPVAPADLSPRSGHSEEGYFSSATTGGGGGVGRKGSIMRRMRGVVGRK